MRFWYCSGVSAAAVETTDRAMSAAKHPKPNRDISTIIMNEKRSTDYEGDSQCCVEMIHED